MAWVAPAAPMSAGSWPSDLIVHVCPTCGHESVIPSSQNSLPETLYCIYCRTASPAPFTHKLQNNQHTQQVNPGTDELSRLFLEHMHLTQEQQQQQQHAQLQNQSREDIIIDQSAVNSEQPFSTLDPNTRAIDSSARYEPAYGYPSVNEATLAPRSQSVPAISAPYDSVMTVYASTHYTHSAHLKKPAPSTALVYDSAKGFNENAHTSADFHNPEPYISSGYAYGHWLEMREREADAPQRVIVQNSNGQGDIMMSD